MKLPAIELSWAMRTIKRERDIERKSEGERQSAKIQHQCNVRWEILVNKRFVHLWSRIEVYCSRTALVCILLTIRICSWRGNACCALCIFVAHTYDYSILSICSLQNLQIVAIESGLSDTDKRVRKLYLSQSGFFSSIFPSHSFAFL